MNQRTVDMLTEMKMAAMVAEFSHQLNDPLFNSLSFEERLSMPITTEWNRRQTNKIDRLIKKALSVRLLRRSKVLNTTRTASWTRPRCSVCPLAGTLMRDTMSFWKVPLAMARHILPARWEMPPAAVLRKSAISVCRSCWTNLRSPAAAANQKTTGHIQESVSADPG